MTPAERALRAGLRRAFPGVHFRYQVPLGPYYADACSHGAKLIIEVDGAQHAEAVEHDAERTRFLEAQGYRVLRFWNGQVLRELEGVLTLIAAHLPSPLAGEGAPPGADGGCATRSRRAPMARDPLPNPPRKGEGFHGQSSGLEF